MGELRPAIKLRVHGSVPPEMWNHLGTKLLPKLKSSRDLRVAIDLEATLDDQHTAESLIAELRQALQELGIDETVNLETKPVETEQQE